MVLFEFESNLLFLRLQENGNKLPIVHFLTIEGVMGDFKKLITVRNFEFGVRVLVIFIKNDLEVIHIELVDFWQDFQLVMITQIVSPPPLKF